MRREPRDSRRINLAETRQKLLSSSIPRIPRLGFRARSPIKLRYLRAPVQPHPEREGEVKARNGGTKRLPHRLRRIATKNKTLSIEASSRVAGPIRSSGYALRHRAGKPSLERRLDRRLSERLPIVFHVGVAAEDQRRG